MPAHKSSYACVFTFGRHVGETLGRVYDTNKKYLEWITEQDNLPEIWRVACAKVLLGESVEKLTIPRIGMAGQMPPTESFFTTLKYPPKIKILKGKTASVQFGYNARILQQFKSLVDSRKWDDKKKHWSVSIVELPKVIKLFGGPSQVDCSDEVKKLIIEEVNRRKDLDVIRNLEDTDINIPGLVTPLYNFQRVGVRFVERAGGRALIADEVGLGKTAQAIAYALKNKRKTLIVCPNSVKIHWAREVMHFTGKESCVWSTKGSEGHRGRQFHIINFDSVFKQLSSLRKIKFDLLVVDEVTNVKNKKTIRAKSIFGDGRQKKKYPGIKTKDAIFLTATPVLNRPIEVFTFLNFLAKDRFPNYYAFTMRYGGWKGEPAKNLDDLHSRTKDVFIRRRLRDIKSEMPDIQVNNIYCELESHEIKEYARLLRDLFRGWKTSGKPTVATMPAIQQFLISKKLSNAIELTDAFVEAGHGTVIFCSYLEPLRQLLKHYGKDAGMIEGKMSPAKRQVVIDAVRAGEKKVALISLKAGGMGIDGLQFGADKVIFLDQSWVPADHYQAQGRVHRNGQKNPVQAFYLLCQNTVDEILREIHIEKQRIADTIVDGTLVTAIRQKSAFGEFVKRLSKQFSRSDSFFDFGDIEE